MPADTMIDAVLPVRGRMAPIDHRLDVSRALLRILPWLADEPDAAIGPIRLAGADSGSAEPGWGLLSTRSHLILRLRRERLDDLAALDRQPLDVGAPRLVLGAARARELTPHGTLYAPYVCSGTDEEADFLEAIDRGLGQLQVRAHVVCGRRSVLRMPEGLRTGWSLMLHGLTREASLRLLVRGLGEHRLLGCGMFVPHKSAAAVGFDAA